MKKLIFTLLLLFPIMTTAQISMNMNLLGTYDYPTTQGNDIWGWVDSLGNEFALVGLRSGFSVVNVTNPLFPIEEFFISDINSTWRDVKTWGNYAYITTEADAGLLIVDLTDMTGNTYSHLSQFSNSTGDNVSFTSAHDIYIDENGIAYIFGAGGSGNQSNGAIFLDVDANPTNPVYLGEWSDEYIHDGMVRGDTMYAGCVYAGKLYIVDVSDKTNPTVLGSAITPNAFTHNVWVSDDGDYVFTTDETSDAYIGAFDISNMNNIQEIDRIQSNPGSNSIPHNTFVDGNFLITSYYRDGTTVHDITHPNNMIQVAYYDSYSGSGNGFDGCWGTYPYLPSGNIISSDINSGGGGSGRLLIYGRNFQQACYFQGNITDCITSSPISNVEIDILNTSTSLVTNLFGDFQTAIIDSGTYNILFSALGYENDTITLSLINGVMITQDIVLCLPCDTIIADIITVNPTCNGSFDGSISVNASGGTAPYSYFWSNGSNNSTIVNLSSAAYILNISDVNGCNVNDLIVNLLEPNPISIDFFLSDYNGYNVTCFNDSDAEVAVSVNGGNLPYELSLDGMFFSSNTNFLNYPAGWLTFYVRDTLGCEVVDSVLISSPDPINANIVIIDSLTCSGLDDALIASIPFGGVLPFSYLWSNGLSNNYIDSVSAGFYLIEVIDGNNCTAFDSIDIINPSLEILQQEFLICDGDNILIGNNIYDAAGYYLDTLVNLNGCNSIIYTNIIIDYSISSYDTLSTNSSVIWNGTILSLSGDYSYFLYNSNGCDSIAYINLTISTTSVDDINKNQSKLVMIIDVLGRKTSREKNIFLIYRFDDGSVEKKIFLE